jgi:hypothetical protein
MRVAGEIVELGSEDCAGQAGASGVGTAAIQLAD